jgi:hypothetical protein
MGWPFPLGGYTRAVDGVDAIWMIESGFVEAGEVWSNVAGVVTHTF